MVNDRLTALRLSETALSTPKPFGPHLLGFACRRRDTRLRHVAQSDLRPPCGVAPGIPVCPPREHGRARPRLRLPLWSASPGEAIPPLHPPACPAQPLACSLSGKPTVSAHTHEGGSISSGLAPDSARVKDRKTVDKDGFHAFGADPPTLTKLLRPASWRLRRP